jgi:hypothetical protein
VIQDASRTFDFNLRVRDSAAVEILLQLKSARSTCLTVPVSLLPPSLSSSPPGDRSLAGSV